MPTPQLELFKRACQLKEELEYRTAVKVFQELLSLELSNEMEWTTKIHLTELFHKLSLKQETKELIKELAQIDLPSKLKAEFLLVRQTVQIYAGLKKRALESVKEAHQIVLQSYQSDIALLSKSTTLFYHGHSFYTEISLKECRLSLMEHLQLLKDLNNPAYNKLEMITCYHLIKICGLLDLVKEYDAYYEHAIQLSKSTKHCDDVLIQIHLIRHFHVTRSSVYLAIQELEKVEFYLKKVYKEDCENNQLYGYLYIQLGNLEIERGDYFEGINYIQKGLQNAIKLDSSVVPLGYLAISDAYYGIQNYDVAQKYALRSVEEITSKSESSNENTVYLAKKYLAKVYAKIDKAKALELFNELIPYFETKTKDLTKNLGLRDCVKVMAEITEGDERKKYNEQLIEYSKTIDYNPFYAAELNIRLGHNHIGEDKEKAINFFEKSLTFLLNGAKFSVTEQNDWNNQNLSFPLSWEAVFGLMKCYLKKYEDTLQEIHLENALTLQNDALSLIDLIQNNFKAEGSILSFNEKLVDFFGWSINALDYKNDLNKNAQIFNSIEKGKARILQMGFNEQKAKKTILKKSNETLIKQLEELKGQLIALETQLATSKTETNETENPLFDVFFEKRLKYKKLLSEVEKKYPEYNEVKNQSGIFSLEEIQSQINDNQVLINYFLHEQNLYAFVLDDLDSELVKIDLSVDLAKKIENYITAINRFETAKTNDLAFELYQILIQPIEDLLYDIFEEASIKDLVIIPHSFMAKLPFDSLLRSKFRSGEPANYLLNGFNISYHYSASLWCLQKQAVPKQQYVYDIVGFAPVYLNRTDNEFSALPFSEEEINEVLALYEQQGKKSLKFMHEMASKAAFIKHAGEAKILHLAAHFHQDENPTLSGLILSKNERIYINETFNLRLNADLVILSACESALGKLYNSEGMMAINRGLLFSGAQNIISTLFKVGDAQSNQLMQLFYQNYLKEQSASQALGNAKRTFILGKKSIPTKYWSAFVLIGSK